MSYYHWENQKNVKSKKPILFWGRLLRGFCSSVGTSSNLKLITIDSISNTFSKIKNYQVSTLQVCWMRGHGPFYHGGF